MNVSGNCGVASNELKQKSTFKDKAMLAGGSIAALAGGSIVPNMTAFPAMGIVGAMSKIGNMSQDKIDLIHKASKDALSIAGLDSKGVNIEWLKPSGKNLKFMDKLKILLNPLKMDVAVQEGLNACFSPLKNKIFMPDNKISYAAFHEIGHAINFNNSKFWRGMQKFRGPAMILASLPMLYGAFTTESKAKDGKELTKLQKTNNFIRDNAGKLSFAAMLPVLAEEGMATIRGQKLANKLLSKDLAKTVLKGNAVGYLAYVLSAVGLAAAAYTAVKIKDAFVNKNNSKKEQQTMQAQQLTAQNNVEEKAVA